MFGYLEDEDLVEIKNYISYCIVDEMKHEFKLSHQIKEMENIPISCLKAQFYYDKLYNRIYLYYELDPRTVNNKSLNMDLIYRRINTKLSRNFYRDHHVYLKLTGPGVANFRYQSRKDYIHMEKKILRPYAFTYWKLFGEYYCFLEDNEMLNRIVHSLYPDITCPNTSNDKLSSFYSKIIEINNKYDFEINNGENIPKGFDEFVEVYKEYFGQCPFKQADENYITKIFIDITPMK